MRSEDRTLRDELVFAPERTIHRRIGAEKEMI